MSAAEKRTFAGYMKQTKQSTKKTFLALCYNETKQYYPEQEEFMSACAYATIAGLQIDTWINNLRINNR